MILRRLAIGVALVAVVATTSWSELRLSAQTKGGAESSAAARVDPSWKVPRTAWGHPDLEGVWASEDMRGVPMSRPEEFGTRAYLSDETTRNLAIGLIGTGDREFRRNLLKKNYS